jgi:hypothetical protein
MRCVSEAGAAVLAAGLGVPVTVLVANRGANNAVECAVQLRVYHPAGSVAGETLHLDVYINLLLDSGSMHWMAIDYPAELEMQCVRPAVEDALGLGSSSFALLPHMFSGERGMVRFGGACPGLWREMQLWEVQTELRSAVLEKEVPFLCLHIACRF